MNHLLAPAMLAAVLGLSACGPADRSFNWLTDQTISGFGLVAPGDRSVPVTGGLTVDRVRRGATLAGAEPLREEEGNVWPAAEGPRATLANPDEALRGVPAYRPETQPATPRPPRTRGSGAALETPAASQSSLPLAPPQPVGAPVLAQERRTVTTPAGTFTILDNPRAGAAIGPGGRTAAVTGDGAVTIISEPGRTPQQVLNPPR